MRFTTPFALILLLTIPYFVWLGQPRLAAGQKWRQWVSLGLRLVILLLLVLSLAGSQLVRAADELAVVFLVDASDSMSQSQAAQAEQFVRQAVGQMGATDQAAVVLFGSNALVERPLTPLAELAPITTIPQPLTTNLAEAIQLGLALFPAGSARRLVVISDGQANMGDAAKAGELAAASGVAIDYVFLPRPEQTAEVTLLDVVAPSRVGAGETFRLEVTAESNVRQTAELRVFAGGNVVYQETVQLAVGVNNFTIRLQASEQEFARYQVQITPSRDTYYQNNELAAFTEVVGAPRVLLVHSTLNDDGTPRPDQSAQLVAALQATGVEVTVAAPNELPADLAGLSNFASVMLVDVNAKLLSPRQMATLQSFVRDLGGGLVAVGGPQSYGMGGYFRTPLEETLPVEMQVKDQDRFPAVSIVIVIDRSGSMSADEGGLTKIQLAAEGAVRVVQLLNDFDEITVIPVDTEPDNPIGPVTASERETAVSRIRQIGAGGGGIYVRTGLQAAADALAQSPNEVKHVILLADGADAEEKEGAPELIQQLVADGATVSTVSIGRGPDTAWLQQMAELGNGRFHFTDRAANLPQIFTQETTAIQRNYLVEERFFGEQVGRSPILNNIPAIPPLFGYVATQAKDAGQVILQTPKGDPLLAVWQYGLGRAVAWTSDATGRWAAEWVPWDGFPVFWAQTVRWTMTQGRNSALESVVAFSAAGSSDGAARLTVDARDAGAGEFLLNGLALEANVVAPNGEVSSVTLQQVAPGRYEADFAPETAGAYLIRVAGQAENGMTVGQTLGWVLGYSPEYRNLAANEPLLQQLAQVTGGRGLKVGEETAVFAHNLPSEPATRPIWLWLTLLTVLLLPLDIGVRRLVLTQRDWERLIKWIFGRLPQREPIIEPARSAQLSQLFAAKQRATALPTERERVPEQGEVEVVGEREKTAVFQPDTTTATDEPVEPPAGTLAARLAEKRRQRQT
ncbi:MAG: VWA domain-containing protein [Ardenticatenaceae bacterium]|nr:VWA domain-containing protein [Ardenticatenaceae bacterium]